ncbi:MAG: patatin-like phospholipase family protein [Gemmatimonadota bacterium]
MKNFALVLAGGGARGFAHAGVLRGLERHGYRPSGIVGVSMGAIIGVTYALREDWYEAILSMSLDAFPTPPGHAENASGGVVAPIRRAVDMVYAAWNMVAGWGAPQATIDAGRELLVHLFGDRKLEDGRIPAIVSATDLRSGSRVAFRKGSAVDAVYASAALAGVVPPVTRDGEILADGAYADVAPVDLAGELGTDAVLAVDPGQLHGPEEVRNGLQAIMRAMEICHLRHAELRFQEADLVFRPPFRRIVDTLELDARAECMAAGLRAVRAARDELRSVLGNPS